MYKCPGRVCVCVFEGIRKSGVLIFLKQATNIHTHTHRHTEQGMHIGSVVLGQLVISYLNRGISPFTLALFLSLSLTLVVSFSLFLSLWEIALSHVLVFMHMCMCMCG